MTVEPNHYAQTQKMEREQEQVVASSEELLAACGLSSLPHVGNHALELIREHHGSFAAALDLEPSQLARTPGLRQAAREALEQSDRLLEKGEKILDSCQKMGVKILLRGTSAYPRSLEVPGAPWLLYVWGELESEGHTPRRVAVVGSRRADDYALTVTRKLVERLVGEGVEVVSGGAQGVDSCAHIQALSAGARTVAVLGVGLSEVSAGERARLLDAVRRKGAVVSEFPLDAAGHKGHFPRRNRTIAALSEAVVITRGAENSGAAHTCRAASELGRPVFAVPGDVTHPLSATPNHLLLKGAARMTLDGTEVLQALGLRTDLPPQQPSTQVSELQLSSVPEESRRVYRVLDSRPMHVDDIATAAQMTIADTLAALLLLEMSGFCQARPGKVFLRS